VTPAVAPSQQIRAIFSGLAHLYDVCFMCSPLG
jgi:hypothetical protein